MATRSARWQGRAAVELYGAGADLVGPTLFDLGDGLDDYMLVGLRLEYCFTRLADDWIAARLERTCRDFSCAHCGTSRDGASGPPSQTQHGGFREEFRDVA